MPWPALVVLPANACCGASNMAAVSEANAVPLRNLEAKDLIMLISDEWF
jgi:hypothetical protein